jgi:hypothetical protein
VLHERQPATLGLRQVRDKVRSREHREPQAPGPLKSITTSAPLQQLYLSPFPLSTAAHGHYKFASTCARRRRGRSAGSCIAVKPAHHPARVAMDADHLRHQRQRGAVARPPARVQPALTRANGARVRAVRDCCMTQPSNLMLYYIIRTI